MLLLGTTDSDFQKKKINHTLITDLNKFISIFWKKNLVLRKILLLMKYTNGCEKKLGDFECIRVCSLNDDGTI